jgi:amino acid adenylation domain-containing protein/FkbM family methyltransferase
MLDTYTATAPEAEAGSPPETVFEFEASFGQQRLWLIDQLEPGSPIYNIPCVVSMNGNLHTEVLERCLSEIVRRHEVLRTDFVSRDGVVLQRINPAGTVTLERTDVSGAEIEQSRQAGRRCAIAEARKPFDLSKGPLVRARLIRLADQEHLLVLTFHHIVSDGWSVGVVIKELTALYDAYQSGESSPLPELQIQYADYAVWQRECLQGDVLQQQIQYWREKLAGLQRLDLAHDRPPSAVRRHDGADIHWRLNRELSGRLKDLCHAEKLTLFMALLAAFQILLARHSGQTDIAVGAPIAGRGRVELEELIGFFINTLVLRGDLSGEPTFREYLGQIRDRVLGAYAHQDLPFEKLVAELQPERSLDHTPLFQVMFALQNAPRGALEVRGLELKVESPDFGFATFDLTFTLWEDGGEIGGSIAYDTDLFTRGHVEQMLAHYERIIEHMVNAPQQSVWRTPLLCSEELRALTVQPSPAASGAPRCLHTMFEEQAARHPGRVAIQDERSSLTYSELNDQANVLAQRLRILGVAPEVRVGLCLERSSNLVVSILAVLKAGGGYVPLDPAYPAERLHYMLGDAQPAVLVTDSRMGRKLDSFKGETVFLDELDHEPAGAGSANPSSGVTPANLAYIIYTSGSTGKPKGAQISHHNVQRLLDITEAQFHFGPEDVWTLFHSYAFDFSVWEIWGALAYGGKLIMVPYEVSRAPRAFYHLVKSNRVTVLNQTPSAFQQFQREDEQQRAELALRVVIFGGEALEIGKLRGWVARHGDARPQLVNMYGITETTVHVTYRLLNKDEIATGGASLIGKPLADLQTYVLDRFMEPAPVGVPGELYVGGAGVALGYWRRPGLTAERFVPDPFSNEPGARLYRTGDRARWQRPGELEYFGRLDDQVKIRGFRIELGEIESVLNGHPSVRESAVIIRDAKSGEKQLVAYVVPRAALGQTEGLYRLPNQLAVAHLNKNETDYLYAEIFERENYTQHGIRLGEGDCIFDVGANIGLFTLYAASKAKHGRIFAFEPIPEIYSKLQFNAGFCRDVNVRVFDFGLGSADRETEFAYYPGYSMMSGIREHRHGRASVEVVKQYLRNQETQGNHGARALLEQADDVLAARFEERRHLARIRRLSDVFREQHIDRVDLLKVDVEGAEIDVLNGIDEGDWSKIRQLVVETEDHGRELDNCVSLLKGHGFEVVVDQDPDLRSTGLYNVYARRTETVGTAEVAGDVPEFLPSETSPSIPAANVPELRAHLNAHLPDYMVPGGIVLLEKLPLTANGKLDRGALPEPSRSQGGDLPRNAAEEMLCRICAEVLGVERVGINENFFELGGHSLLATQVTSRIHELIGVPLSLRSLFENPTVAGLAQLIEKGAGTLNASPIPKIVPVARTRYRVRE